MARTRITVGDVVRAALHTSVERLVAHEKGVRAGADPEDVHQARVATRRLRSDLRTFEDFVDEAWTTEVRAELRWLGSELGRVRDIEVLLERLRSDAATLPDDERDAAERVVRRLVADWEHARHELVRVLATPRYTQLVERLRAAVQHPRFTNRADEKATKALAEVVRKPWRKLRRAVDELGPAPPDSALHGVRIKAKRARYATEATISVYGKPAKRLARALEAVQTVLGDHQDAVVARGWLTKTGDECTPAEAFAAGMLAQLQIEAADATRREFPSVWKAARARRPSTWL